MSKDRLLTLVVDLIVGAVPPLFLVPAMLVGLMVSSGSADHPGDRELRNLIFLGLLGLIGLWWTIVSYAISNKKGIVTRTAKSLLLLSGMVAVISLSTSYISNLDHLLARPDLIGLDDIIFISLFALPCAIATKYMWKMWRKGT